MKTRFGFFSWGVRCQLCKQQVCSKCSTKVVFQRSHLFEAEIHFYVNADEDSSGALHSDSGVGAFWSLFVQAVVIDGEPGEPEIGGIGTVIARNAAQRQGNCGMGRILCIWSL